MRSLSQKRLKKLIHYDPSTGEFRWLARKDMNSWNAKHAGKIAGCRWDSPNVGVSYRVIVINNKINYAHRLAFLYMEGKVPATVDHRDRDGLNNRWSNLRAAVNGQNQMNKRKQNNNTTGLKGAYFDKRRSVFFSQIHVRGRIKYLGAFDCVEKAHAAYIVAAKRVYGEFARAA